MHVADEPATSVGGPRARGARQATAWGSQAFGELYTRFSRAVHGVGLARAPYRDAPDLVQDVFASALERLPQLGEPDAFPGWILAIARNRAIDHLRVKKLAVEELDDVGSETSGIRASAEVHRVLFVLRALPEAYHPRR